MILEKDSKFLRKKTKDYIVYIVLLAIVVTTYVWLKVFGIIEINSYDIAMVMIFFFLPLYVIYFLTKELICIVDVRKVKISNDCIYIGDNKIENKDIENIIIIARFQELICVRKWYEKNGEWHIKTSIGPKKLDYFMDKPPVINLSGDIKIEYKGKQYKVYGIQNILEVARMIYIETNIKSTRISVYYVMGSGFKTRYNYFENNYKSNIFIDISGKNNKKNLSPVDT
ncbi:putative membrane protein [Clostridium bornimense]|uniref:Putative membrane protein n=1 Tax=Clostridium bornimense TaxID=1216932 RepID=W6RUT5_9CLOT|nr:hypothetical protein [Clostridium bornimense]CDM68088.1 putative membrane protein [Clostridium bornimense]